MVIEGDEGKRQRRGQKRGKKNGNNVIILIKNEKIRKIISTVIHFESVE